MAGASEWSPGLHAAMRLLDGGPDDRSGRTFKAGVEIRLDPHFKTYWRTPGDSGIPPVFEWSQSQNVANVEVLWPAPYRFEDTAGASIGYKDRVVFPIKVTAADPKRPVVLVLQLDYAVCEKICIPVKGEARLTLASAGLSTHNSMAVADAEARVPTPARVGDNTPPAIRFIGIASGGKGLLVDALVLRRRENSRYFRRGSGRLGFRSADADLDHEVRFRRTDDALPDRRGRNAQGRGAEGAAGSAHNDGR